MCIYIYIYIYTYMHKYMYTYIHIHMYIYTYEWGVCHIYIYVYMYIYIYTSVLPSMSIDCEVLRQWCTLGIGSSFGSSNEASFELTAVVEVQMEVQMTVQTSSACASWSSPGVHLGSTRRALWDQLEDTWSQSGAWRPVGRAKWIPKGSQEASKR